MEGAELDGDAGTDSDEGGEGAFVECEGSFSLVDGFGGDEGVGVLGCGLKTDFDYVEWLAWAVLVFALFLIYSVPIESQMVS